MTAAAVFHHIVQQPGDGLFFVAAAFQHQRGHAQQMAQIRNLRALAHLPGMGDARVIHGQGVTFGESGHGASDAGMAHYRRAR